MVDPSFGALTKLGPEVLQFAVVALRRGNPGGAGDGSADLTGSMACAIARLKRRLGRHMPDRRAAETHRDMIDWLVLHALLPTLCDPDILEETLRHNAPLWERYRHGKSGLPLEFEAIKWALQSARPRDPFPVDLMAAMADATRCCDVLDFEGIPLRRLGRDALASGSGGAILREAKLLQTPPLAYYLGKEIDVFGQGARFGPLGSLILAEVLAGQVIHDRASFWHKPGSDGGRWHPRDDVFPAGEPVDSVAALLRAARPT